MLEDDDGHGSHSTAKLRLRQNLQAYYAVFNGLPDEDALVHHCPGKGCCSSAAHSQARMAAAITSSVLRNIPVTPSATKWTKLGPCLDAILLGQQHHLWGRLFHVAFGKMKFESDDTAAGAASDQNLKNDVGWHELAGKRYKKAHSFIGSVESQRKLRVLSVVLEAVRYLTKYFLRCSREHTRPSAWCLLLECAVAIFQNLGCSV